VKLTTQSVLGNWGMKSTIAILPILFAAIAMVLLIFYPLTEKRHNIIVRRLEQRRDRHQTIDEP